MDSPSPAFVRFVSLERASALVGLPTPRIRRYLRAGLVAAPRFDGRKPLLGPQELARLRRIRRLTDDLGMNLAGVEVTLHLIDVITSLREARRTERSARY